MREQIKVLPVLTALGHNHCVYAHVATFGNAHGIATAVPGTASQ